MGSGDAFQGVPGVDDERGALDEVLVVEGPVVGDDHRAIDAGVERRVNGVAVMAKPCSSTAGTCGSL